jgi:hypothetical protein
MKIKKKIARSFNFTFHYIDDVLSLNNSRFGDLLITERLVIVSSGCPLNRGGCIKTGFNCSFVTCPPKLYLNMSSKKRWLF